MWPFKKQPEVKQPKAAPVIKRRARPELMGSGRDIPRFIKRRVERYVPPPGVIPEAVRSQRLAFDEQLAYDSFERGESFDSPTYSAYGYTGFPGYPYLSNLTQIAEYRNATQTVAEELTRKWIELRYEDDDGPPEKIQEITRELHRLKVREVFREAATHDGFFGRGQIYVELKSPAGVPVWLDANELATPLILDPVKIPKGHLIGFKVIEPYWTYPGVYNSTDPVAPNWYWPRVWYIMSRTVHDSRLLTIILNPVPDILKAAYNFSGISRSQLIETYVQNWLRTRDSVSDVVHAHSVHGLKTDMNAALADDLAGSGLDNMLARIDLFNRTRDNRGALVLNNETEEYFQYDTNLSGLDKLQAQAVEHISYATRIPLVKQLGVTPSGLNASSEGELRVFYDTIKAYQESMFREALTKVLKLVQLNLYGKIDENLTFEFVPLFELTETEKVRMHYDQARADALYVQEGILTPEQAHDKVVNEPETPYTKAKEEGYKNVMPLIDDVDTKPAGATTPKTKPKVSAGK